MKKLFGILGYPVNHSLSPAMHNAAFKALKIEAEYQLFAVKPEKLKMFFDRVRQENMAGLSVTIPHKIAVMEFLDQIDDKAKAIGAVNTTINKNGRLIGTNTDCDGAIEALMETVVSLTNKKVMVFGAGGAARSIAYGLHEQGAAVVILNRDLKKARELAEKYNFKADVIENCYQYPADIIMQTTPVGMEPNSEQSIVPTDYLKSGLVVFDIVYRPKMTKLLQEAKAKGCQIITGDKMLLYQAVKQFELFTGEKAPIEVMRESLIIS